MKNTIVLILIGVLIGVTICRFIISEKEPRTKQDNLQDFYIKTQSEIKSSQGSIQKVIDEHGEQAGVSIVKEIVFKNFCEIPGVIDTTISQKITIK